MELKELTDRTLELFGVTALEQLGPALLVACDDPEKLRSFCELVGGDMSTDWLQKIYQYYLADRKEKKQDYTPAFLARFMGMLAGDIGWTFPQLAKDMDVREETLQRWLTGERMITVFGLVRASRVLGVSMEKLTRGII